MIDREKVIKGLEWILNDIEENGHYQINYYAEEIRKAIALLKEQEAKLVLNIADSIAGMEVGDCPWCGRYLVNRISDPSKFCKYCGQAVKWE